MIWTLRESHMILQRKLCSSTQVFHLKTFFVNGQVYRIWTSYYCCWSNKVHIYLIHYSNTPIKPIHPFNCDKITTEKNVYHSEGVPLHFLAEHSTDQFSETKFWSPKFLLKWFLKKGQYVTRISTVLIYYYIAHIVYSCYNTSWCT